MSKNNTIAVIDIGTEKICTIIAAVSREDNQNITVTGVATTPSRGLRKSQIVDLDEAVQSITVSLEAAERMAGDTVKDAYISISGAHIQSQNSKGVVAVAEPEGEITENDIARVMEAARAVSLPQAREIIHVLSRDYAVDAQTGIKDPTGMTGIRLEAEAHLITASSTALKNAIKCASEVGVNVESAVFSGVASSYAVLSETEKELGVILVDIGGGTTSICVFVEGSLIHSCVIPVGAKNITNDLAIGMRLSLASAEKVKLHLSNQLNNPDKFSANAKVSEIVKQKQKADLLDLHSIGVTEDATSLSQKSIIDGIIEPRLVELFSLIKEELKKHNLLNLVPAGVVVTGGGAETVGITDTAKRTLGLPVRIGRPEGLSGIVEEINSPAFAAAYGMVKYAIKKPLSNRSDRSNFKLPSIGFSGLDKQYQRFIDLIKSFFP